MKWSLLALFLLAAPCAAHAQGALPENEADVAGIPEAPATRAPFLPPRVDLSGELPPPLAQASTETCVSWAVTYAAGSHWWRRHGGPPDLALSPAFTYGAAGGGKWCQGGTKITRTLSVLRDQGALPMADYRFDPGWCGRQPTAGEREAALRWRIPGWLLVPADISRVKEQLAAHHPVIFSVPPVPDTFTHFRGEGVFNDLTSGTGSTGHAMTLVGYDDGRKAFRVMNSFGRGWGDGGYAWFSYDVWKRQVPFGFIVGKPDAPKE